MKGEGLTVVFAVRTAKGERRRIRSFLKQIEELGVEIENLPPASVKALTEADKFLGRYIDLLSHETPNAEQLEGVMEALGGIDRVVKNAMAEVLKSLGWRPDKAPVGDQGDQSDQSDQSETATDMTPRAARAGKAGKTDRGGAPSGPTEGGQDGARSPAREERGKVIQFPGPRARKPD